jgi:hypothetical protein
VRTLGGEVCQYYLFKADIRRNVPMSLGVPFDSLLKVPRRPTFDNLPESAPQWIGTLTKVFTGAQQWTTDQEWRTEHDNMRDLFFPFVDHRMRQQEKILSRQSAKQPRSRDSEVEIDSQNVKEQEPTAKKQAAAARNEFSQAQQSLAERGEKLQNLDQKFSDLAEQSRGFLETVREYNKKQKEKKWYEF